MAKSPVSLIVLHNIKYTRTHTGTHPHKMRKIPCFTTQALVFFSLFFFWGEIVERVKVTYFEHLYKEFVYWKTWVDRWHIVARKFNHTRILYEKKKNKFKNKRKKKRFDELAGKIRTRFWAERKESKRFTHQY